MSYVDLDSVARTALQGGRAGGTQESEESWRGRPPHGVEGLSAGRVPTERRRDGCADQNRDGADAMFLHGSLVSETFLTKEENLDWRTVGLTGLEHLQANQNKVSRPSLSSLFQKCNLNVLH